MVADMVKEMGLSPQQIQQMDAQRQLGTAGTAGTAGMQQQPQQGNLPIGEMTPEDQMKIMEQMQQQQQIQQHQQQMQTPQQVPPQQFQQQPDIDSSDSDSTVSTASDVSLDQLQKLGIGNSESIETGFFDKLLNNIKLPIVVAIIFIIISLPQVDTLLASVIPSKINNNLYYNLAIKAILGALMFLLFNMFLA
jgi:hypothetical protein